MRLVPRPALVATMPLLVGVGVLTSQGCAQKQPAEKPWSTRCAR